jgi:hypothetical protein
VAKDLKQGLETPRLQAPVKMVKEDKSLAQTPGENAKVFADHFVKLYGAEADFDVTVLDGLQQRPVQDHLGLQPSEEEVKRGLASLNNSSPGDSGICAPLWKCLLESDEGFELIMGMVTKFWEKGEMPPEWEVNLLKIIPKKGDLKMPGNYRGIMLLEVAYKIVAKIILGRLTPIKEGLDHEAQCGFRPGRGTMDALSSLKALANKRREHSMETWILMLDLVEAFDTVPRQLLWLVLLKMGVPTKLVDLLKSMHEVVRVKFVVSGVEKHLQSIIGVKQGDLLGPELFTFFMAAVMATWRASASHPLCVLRSKMDFVLTGRKSCAAGSNVPITDLEYADDTGVPFRTRADLVEHTPHVIAHFKRWGLQVHQGLGDKRSKSEVLFCAAPSHCYNDQATWDGADLSDVLLPGGHHMGVVLEFKYLGSIMASNGKDASDVESRIQAASKAFGMLRKPVFSSKLVSTKAKHVVYLVVVMSILLYGCECWSLTVAMVHKLKCFHARCVRCMCGVSLKTPTCGAYRPENCCAELDWSPLTTTCTAGN